MYSPVFRVIVVLLQSSWTAGPWRWGHHALDCWDLHIQWYSITSPATLLWVSNVTCLVFIELHLTVDWLLVEASVSMNDVNTSYEHKVIYMHISLHQNLQIPYFFKCLHPYSNDSRDFNFFVMVVVILLIAAFGWNRFSWTKNYQCYHQSVCWGTRITAFIMAVYHNARVRT